MITGMTDALPSPESFFLCRSALVQKWKEGLVYPSNPGCFFSVGNDGDFRVRVCQTTGRDSCREPVRRGIFHAGTLRR